MVGAGALVLLATPGANQSTIRLHWEDEWEYACRAGTTTPFHWGPTITSDVANFDGTHSYGVGPAGEFRKRLTPVGSFGRANPFGLFDMHGHVWEWRSDVWHDDYEGAPSDGSAWLSGVGSLMTVGITPPMCLVPA
jgi:formylglycine-generating enzyme required for sulfatase activity